MKKTELKRISKKILLALGLLLMTLRAANAEASLPVAGEKLGIFVTGLSGSHQFKSHFNRAISQLHQALLWNGYNKEQIVRFSERKESDLQWGKTEVADKESLLRGLDALSHRDTPYEEVFIFVGGHANGRDEEAMLHLPGNDLMLKDLMEKLNAIPAKRSFLIVATPQGEAWIKMMGKPGRVVIAGNGNRQYDFIPMQFLRFFPEMFTRVAKSVPDSEPKEWRSSLLDIFVKTQQKTQRWYRNNNLHSTELAYLDADGDGKGESLFVEAAPSPTASPLPKVSESVNPNAPLLKEESSALLPLNLDLPDAKMAAAIYFNVEKEKKHER